jgi:hypothetical protein
MPGFCFVQSYLEQNDGVCSVILEFIRKSAKKSTLRMQTRINQLDGTIIFNTQIMFDWK